MAKKDSHILPENTAQTTGNGFLFNDWECAEDVPEINQANGCIPLEGRIITRMPDLGSEPLTAGIPNQTGENAIACSYWTRLGQSLSAMIQGDSPQSARPQRSVQQLFHRLTAFGCVLLLCGLVVLFLERGNHTDDSSTAQIESDEAKAGIAETLVAAKEDTIPFPPASFSMGQIGMSAESHQALAGSSAGHSSGSSSGTSSGSVIPGTTIESFGSLGEAQPGFPNTAQSQPAPPTAHSQVPEAVESAWNRPVADSYSPWDVAARQSEVAQPIPNGFVPPPMGESPPVAAVAMSPMIDMSMPVSPYEQQIIAQSTVPSYANPMATPSASQMPDPFAQQQGFQPHPASVGNVPIPGAPMPGVPMPGVPMPNFGTQGVVPTQWPSMPPQGQYNEMPHHHLQGMPQGQHHVGRPASAPPQPQYMPPEAMQSMQNPHMQPQPQQGVSPNMPIPSAASTLHQQGGYYPQQHNPHRGFY